MHEYQEEVIGRIIAHLELTFDANSCLRLQVVQQKLLMAAEEMAELLTLLISV
jgi:hypothetical protein